MDESNKDNQKIQNLDFTHVISFSKNNNNININNNEKDTISYSKLTSAVIKEEAHKRKLSSDINSEFEETYNNYIFNNILKLVIMILFICIFFFFKKNLIDLKIKYLSDKSLFKFNIFYSDANNSFLLFVIMISCRTISSGLKLMLLQIITYILTFILILLKNRKYHLANIFQNDIVVFHCSDIIISFLYLGEKIKKINLFNQKYKFFKIILIIFNINIMIYFVLVEIINCQYERIIIDVLYGLIISIFVYFFIFYILKFKIRPKRIISIMVNNIIISTIISISFIIIFFIMCFHINKAEYFFVNKVLTKYIGFLFFIIFEIYYIFRDKEDKKFQFYYLYNIYSNKYLYSETNQEKIIIRVILSILIEHFLLSKLDITFKNNISNIKCIFIIILDISHGFLILFLIKIIFKLIDLNNKSLFEIDINNTFMRYGSFAEGEEEDDPLFFIEKQ